MAIPSPVGTNGERGAALDSANFRDFIDFIRPQAGELNWLSIPWQTDLREACRMATEERKPIFLWTMNGNPLGCT